MLAVLSVVLALQVGISVGTGGGAKGDSAVEDSVRRAAARERRRIPLTPELLASAYRDARARDLITRAREARLRQDSSLVSYDALSKQRISAGLAFRSGGRDRLVFRSENAARVRWRQGVGAWVDVVGARTAIPPAFPGARVLASMIEGGAIPYYPGREGLLNLAGVEQVTQRDEGLFIHPLDRDAEAYYQYRSGDSVSFRLPDGKHIQLREVDVVPRRPRFDLIVGSLWFDVASAQLVRAAFRPSMPWDIARFVKEEDPHAFEDVPRWVKPIIFPMELQVAAFTVEYGLHEQRWWLPRIETVEGRARAGFMRVPFSAEQSYRYSSVNGIDSLPPIVVAKSDSLKRNAGVGVPADERDRAGPDIDVHADSPRDSRAERRRRHHAGDHDEDIEGLRCTPGDTLVRPHLRYEGTLKIAVRIPCDTVALAHSPELPASIFDSGEETFDLKARDELVRELSLSLQPGWGPLPPTIHYGLERGLLRYNRVEGLSAGVSVEEGFGEGLTGEALAQIGVADLEPNGELRLRRSDGRRTVGLAVYRRLNSASDWGDPLSVGSSLSAFLFGRDEGFYYRSWGAELTGSIQRSSSFGWRLFVERQRRAAVETQFSIPNVINGTRFIDNIETSRAGAVGVGSSFHSSYGLDPHGLRAVLDLRAEGAVGTFDYARGALDLTVSHGIGSWLDGALTVSAGTSGGHVPPQRLWYLGSVETVRGQRAGTRSGDAFWLSRAELGSSFVATRPVVFVDFGWAGSRRDWARPGRPISGAGVGASIMDGLIRFDLARGIHPSRGLRTDLYLEARF